MWLLAGESQTVWELQVLSEALAVVESQALMALGKVALEWTADSEAEVQVESWLSVASVRVEARFVAAPVTADQDGR